MNAKRLPKLATDTKKRKAQALELREEREFKRGLLNFIGPQCTVSKDSRTSRDVALGSLHSNDLAATPDAPLDAIDKEEAVETPRSEKLSGEEIDLSPISVTKTMAEFFRAPKRSPKKKPLGCGQTDRTDPRGNSSANRPQVTARISLGNANANTALTPAHGTEFLKDWQESISRTPRPEVEVTPNHKENWLANQRSPQSTASDSLFDEDETAEV